MGDHADHHAHANQHHAHGDHDMDEKSKLRMVVKECRRLREELDALQAEKEQQKEVLRQTAEELARARAARAALSQVLFPTPANSEGGDQDNQASMRSCEELVRQVETVVLVRQQLRLEATQLDKENERLRKGHEAAEEIVEAMVGQIEELGAALMSESLARRRSRGSSGASEASFAFTQSVVKEGYLQKSDTRMRLFRARDTRYFVLTPHHLVWFLTQEQFRRDQTVRNSIRLRDYRLHQDHVATEFQLVPLDGHGKTYVFTASANDVLAWVDEIQAAMARLAHEVEGEEREGGEGARKHSKRGSRAPAQWTTFM